jgi:glycine/D-amino acid oxidase-like deaminating enzyme
LIANNGFASKLVPALELEAVRNQVIVTDQIPNLSLSGAYHMHQGYFYFRDIDSRVLIGGGRHLDKVGETTNTFGNNTLVEAALIELLDTVVLKDLPYKIDYKWSGILGVGPNKQPIKKQHSENIFLAVRLGGMGVALGSLLGKEIAEMI